MTLADLLSNSMSEHLDIGDCPRCAAETTLDGMAPLLLEAAQRALDIAIYGEHMDELLEVLNREVL